MSSASLQLWEYRELQVAPVPTPPPLPADLPVPQPAPGFTEAQLADRVQAAIHEAEQRWHAAAEQQERRREQQVGTTLQAFAVQRARYFREAESEVVHLALALARKILAREAALDPDLLHALVHIALNRMGAGAAVKLRLPPAELERWQQVKAGAAYEYELCPDPSLAPGECIAETDLGSASLGLGAQFKELEQGIEDLLKLRPQDPVSSDTNHKPEEVAGSLER